MDSFTIGRAIRIMLFLTLAAGSYVYHRELGQALIWLGHQIVGEDTPETSPPCSAGDSRSGTPDPSVIAAVRAVPPATADHSAIHCVEPSQEARAFLRHPTKRRLHN